MFVSGPFSDKKIFKLPYEYVRYVRMYIVSAGTVPCIEWYDAFVMKCTLRTKKLYQVPNVRTL